MRRGIRPILFGTVTRVKIETVHSRARASEITGRALTIEFASRPWRNAACFFSTWDRRVCVTHPSGRSLVLAKWALRFSSNVQFHTQRRKLYNGYGRIIPVTCLLNVYFAFYFWFSLVYGIFSPSLKMSILIIFNLFIYEFYRIIIKDYLFFH